MTPAGNINTVAGNGNSGFSGEGGSALAASFNTPSGVALDAAGDLYIADYGNNRIRMVSGGTISTVAGNGSTASPEMGVQQPRHSTGLRDWRLIQWGTYTLPTPRTIASARFWLASRHTRHRRQHQLFGPPAEVQPEGRLFSLSAPFSGLAFTASVSASWLTVTPSTGIIPATLQVTADPSTLAGGHLSRNHHHHRSQRFPGDASRSQSHFTVQPAAPAASRRGYADVSFIATQGEALADQHLRSPNTGGGSLAFTASATTSSGGSWLSISPASGTATASAALRSR